MDERVLFVDDDPNILEAYQRKLQHVLHVRTAQGPHPGLREIQEKGPFAVVVADMNMPLMNGVEFLKKVREIAPDTVRMMLTGNSDVKTAMDAVNEGCVFRFLTKPCPSKLMGDSLVAAVQQHRLITAEKEVLEGTLKGTAELLTEIISWVSPGIFGRAVQLRNTVKSISAKLETESPWETELAATLCQIGMLALPSETLARVSEGKPMDDEDRKAVEGVPAIGHELLERIPRLENVARIVLYQNKRFNGDGFPRDQVAGADIPLGSRILKVAADYHELRTSGQSRQESLKTMQSRDGWYDPGVLRTFGRESFSADVQLETIQIIAMPFKELRAGLTLASPILTSEGRMLVAAGTAITDAFLVRLRKFAVTSGIVEPIEVVIQSQPA
ncbi:MAG: response regulator [Candidatus Hydrogenedentes bacterium]|nr:response regulator [Candidatus Hydrogenedentota bacterium]